MSHFKKDKLKYCNVHKITHHIYLYINGNLKGPQLRWNIFTVLAIPN